MVDVLAEATRKFHRNLQRRKGWKANHKRPRGACTFMLYFIGQCVWVFRRAYVRWTRQQVNWAGLQAVYDFTEDAANEAGIGALLQTAYEIDDSEVFSTNSENILDELAPHTQAVVRLTVMGFPDAEIRQAASTPSPPSASADPASGTPCTRRPASTGSGPPNSSTPRPPPAGTTSGVRREHTEPPAPAPAPAPAPDTDHPRRHRRPHRIQHRPRWGCLR
ncbi:hypothetical protein ABZ445_39140 [Streptomyces chartreusis]|uniref:hypothetical protein n=1 Tax=Streptomyces chartreusis TaxID=1969 RepID=UPI0033EA42F8